MPDAAQSHPAVARNEDAGRYEALIDGALAGYVEFRERPGRIVFTHTETLPDFSGQGVGSALAEQALADAVARDLTIVPLCPFIARYLQRHEIDGATIEWPPSE